MSASTQTGGATAATVPAAQAAGSTSRDDSSESKDAWYDRVFRLYIGKTDELSSMLAFLGSRTAENACPLFRAAHSVLSIGGGTGRTDLPLSVLLEHVKRWTVLEPNALHIQAFEAMAKNYVVRNFEMTTGDPKDQAPHDPAVTDGHRGVQSTLKVKATPRPHARLHFDFQCTAFDPWSPPAGTEYDVALLCHVLYYMPMEATIRRALSLARGVVLLHNTEVGITHIQRQFSRPENRANMYWSADLLRDMSRLGLAKVPHFGLPGHIDVRDLSRDMVSFFLEQQHVDDALFAQVKAAIEATAPSGYLDQETDVFFITREDLARADHARAHSAASGKHTGAH